MNECTAIDREFFKENPHRDDYVRPSVEGETEPYVHVIRIAPGEHVLVGMSMLNELSDVARLEGRSPREYVRRQLSGGGDVCEGMP